MTNKSDSRCAVIRFCYHSYDYRPNWTPLMPLPLLISGFELCSNTNSSGLYYPLCYPHALYLIRTQSKGREKSCCIRKRRMSGRRYDARRVRHPRFPYVLGARASQQESRHPMRGNIKYCDVSINIKTFALQLRTFDYKCTT